MSFIPIFLKGKIMSKVRSVVTGIEYIPEECVRIVNPTQVATYLIKGVRLIDIYGSKDFNTGKPVLVSVFNRKESQEAFTEWRNYKEV